MTYPVEILNFVRPGFIATPETGSEDRTMVFMTPDRTFLYSEQEGGNIMDTQRILEKLETLEGASYARVGEIQAFAGGVPEILISGSPAERDEEVLFLANLVKERGVVPQGTPVFALREGHIVEVTEAPAFSM